MGGAGGVGSILIQLARQLTQLRVVATASRPETVQWCHELGAHDVIDHRQPLAQALRAQTGLAQVELVASLTQTDQHFPHIVELLAPQGRLALIDDPQAIDIRALKQKSISLHWESMFTRSLFQTADMPVQGQLLATVAQLVEQTHERLLDDDARAVANLAEFVENCKKPLFFVGDGASLCYNKYSNVPGVLTVPPELRGGRAAAVALVAKQMAQRGEAVLPEALLPDYHRLSQAERERAERLAAEAAARNNDTENGKD